MRAPAKLKVTRPRANPCLRVAKISLLPALICVQHVHELNLSSRQVRPSSDVATSEVYIGARERLADMTRRARFQEAGQLRQCDRGRRACFGAVEQRRCAIERRGSSLESEADWNIAN